MCVWPKTTASQRGKRGAQALERGRPPVPGRAVIPIRTPPSSSSRRAGSSARTAALSTLPWIAWTGGPSERSSSSTGTSERSPACRIASAARQRARQAGGIARAPRGMCVSLMIASCIGADATVAGWPHAESLTVAVTGPTGTFGFGLMPLLEADERVGRVVGIARRPFDPAEHGWTKMEYRRGDVRDPAALAQAFAGADVVVHLAFLITGASDCARSARSTSRAR